jgi:NDP-sugar pyrophosphorylase family protein
VLAGLILVVENEKGRDLPDSTASEGRRQPALVEGPLACVEILGKSLLERTIEGLLSSDLDVVSVVLDEDVAECMPFALLPADRLKLQVVEDVWVTAAQRLCEFAETGIDHAFICNGNAYVECDLVDLLQFHRSRRQAITRAFSRDGVLDLWVVDCARVKETNLGFLFDREQEPSVSPCYFVREYVNRLTHPGDIRRLVVDAFRRHCHVQPVGHETRPGVWVDEGANIHKRARIVAPAYIGRRSRVLEDTLITRYSNVESLCHIDYGTVIEDSSILASSYVGIWLDVSHTIVRGNKLLNLGRNVVLEISDSSMLRGLEAVSKDVKRETVAEVAAV